MAVLLGFDGCEKQVPKDLKPLDTVLLRPWQLAFPVFAVASKQKHTLFAVCKTFRKVVEWFNRVGPAKGSVSCNERWFCRPTTEFHTPYRIIYRHDCYSCRRDPRYQNGPKQFEYTRLATTKTAVNAAHDVVTKQAIQTSSLAA